MSVVTDPIHRQSQSAPGPSAPRSDSATPWYPTNDGVRRTATVGLGTVLAFAPLFVIFTDWQWLIDGVGATLCVLVPAMVLRYRSVPRTTQLLPGLVVLVLYCTVLYLGQAAAGGLIPGPQAWTELGNLREIAGQQIHDNVSPLNSTHALRAFVVPGLGLFAALVDWYAVVRRAPALAGVPLLALFTVCGAIAGSTVGWIPFTSAAAGFLLILSADSRINLLSWGRIVPRRHGDRVTRARLGLSGRRIGVVAVVAAVVIPALIPGLSRNLLADSFHGGGSGSGTTGGTSLSPFADLKGQLVAGKTVNLAEVTVSGTTTNPYFVRSKVLDRFTGSGWVASEAFRGDPVSSQTLAGSLPQGGATTSYTATFKIANLDDVAPILGSAKSFDGLRSAWRFRSSDATIGGSKTKRNETYTERVVAPTPTAAQLAASSGSIAQFASLTALPNAFPASVRTQVSSLIEGATTPYERATALFNFFKDPANGFTYSLETKAGDSGSDLVDFLNGRSGYCQQYAAALGVMFRAAGIPARVVLGYTHPAPDKNGRFTVTSHDAHAWVEGYFAGIGWLPFNPTPLTGDNASRNIEVPYAAGPASTTSTASSAATSSATSAGASSSASNRANQESNAGSGAVIGGSGGPPTWMVALVVAAVIALAALLVLPALRIYARRARFRDALRNGHLEPLWRELQAAAADTSTAWPASTTPRQVPAWLRQHGVKVDTKVESLAGSVERERYAPPVVEPGSLLPASATNIDISDGIERVQAISRAMRATMSRSGRLRALLIPKSTLPRRQRGDLISD
ncbi:MAG: Transglutaminase-like enzyme putative cysteine protease [Pseudonocardiales bacterium]|nr:Transglutaminase-like enzyme putative cysteine protease [Pseudonocardiales bacterium]